MFRQGFQNVVQIVTHQNHVLDAMRPENSDVGAVVCDEYDFNSLRRAPAVMVLVFIFFFVVVFISVVVVVRAPFHDDRIGLDGGVHLLISRRHALKLG